MMGIGGATDVKSKLKDNPFLITKEERIINLILIIIMAIVTAVVFAINTVKIR